MRPLDFSERLSADSLAVFLFHGVIEQNHHPVRNYTGKHIVRDEFEAIVRNLCSSGTAISMDQAVECIANGEVLPPRAFAITFDDGFANNFDIAAPILADLHVPATIYVCTGFVEHNAMSWIDRIEYAVELAKGISLQLPWRSGKIPLRSVSDKLQTLNEIRSYVKRDPSIDIDQFVQDVFRQCRIPSVTGTDDPLDKKMTWSQVAQLNEHPNFTVGGHTHNHRIMSFLSPTELEFEITTSLRLLQENARADSKHYSYPEGLTHCYNDQVIGSLLSHGVACCPTAEDGVNHRGDSLFHLKRILVG